jgi:hypothetical protein
MATSNHKPGSYSQPDNILLTFSRQELKDLLENPDWQTEFKTFKMRAGIRLEITVRVEDRTAA